MGKAALTLAVKYLQNVPWNRGEAGGNPGGRLREGTTLPGVLRKVSPSSAWGFTAGWVSGSPEGSTGEPWSVSRWGRMEQRAQEGSQTRVWERRWTEKAPEDSG